MRFGSLLPLVRRVFKVLFHLLADVEGCLDGGADEADDSADLCTRRRRQKPHVTMYDLVVIIPYRYSLGQGSLAEIELKYPVRRAIGSAHVVQRPDKRQVGLLSSRSLVNNDVKNYAA